MIYGAESANVAVSQIRKRTSKIMRRAAVFIAAAVILAVAGGASPAHASPSRPAVPLVGPDVCSSAVDSGFNWAQDACILWNGSEMIGSSIVATGNGFNHGNVTRCELEGTLVSSYGTTHTYHQDCTSPAQDPTGPLFRWDQHLGPGRQAGDTYTWHACLRVWTSVLYNSCAGPHPVSPPFVR
jgi:hypothetical protein